MKIYCVNYNGILDRVIEILKERGEYTDDYFQASAFILWQDVRGECSELADIVRVSLGKPSVVVQHGRGASRDYCFPNKFELKADKILVWGQTEQDRLQKAGIAKERIEIVGSPLIPRLKPRIGNRPGKNILFVPVIAQKEEPENILVYNTLRIWESRKCISRIQREFDKFKKGWAWQENIIKKVQTEKGEENRLWKSEVRPILPRWVTYSDGLINVKLTPVHDLHQYQSPSIMTGQNDPRFIESLVELLANVDAMVCLEEGTMQLLACALDIPVIVCDIFKYQTYGGCKDYDRVEKIKTNACYWTTDLNKLPGLLDHALANPAELRKWRIKTVEAEGAPQLGDANVNIVNAVERMVNVRNAFTNSTERLQVQV